jgi:hypothetical protein
MKFFSVATLIISAGMLLNPVVALSLESQTVMAPGFKLADVPPPKWKRVEEDVKPSVDCSKKNEKKPECREIINESPREERQRKSVDGRRPA